MKQLLRLAGNDSPLAGAAPGDVELREEGVFLQGESAGESFVSILRRSGREQIEIEAAGSMPFEMMKYSINSYGAQFCEVRVSEVTGEVRVSRWLGVFDTGTILNPKTAASQFRGGIVIGIGAALTEEAIFDERSGRIMNPSLAEYHVPVHADIPAIDVEWLNLPDPITPRGARGVGEIGITEVAAAIANAVFNATGKRIRRTPISPGCRSQYPIWNVASLKRQVRYGERPLSPGSATPASRFRLSLLEISRSAKTRVTSAMFSVPQVHSGTRASAKLRPNGVRL